MSFLRIILDYIFPYRKEISADNAFKSEGWKRFSRRQLLKMELLFILLLVFIPNYIGDLLIKWLIYPVGYMATVKIHIFDFIFYTVSPSSIILIIATYYIMKLFIKNPDVDLLRISFVKRGEIINQILKTVVEICFIAICLSSIYHLYYFIFEICIPSDKSIQNLLNGTTDKDVKISILAQKEIINELIGFPCEITKSTFIAYFKIILIIGIFLFRKMDKKALFESWLYLMIVNMIDLYLHKFLVGSLPPSPYSYYGKPLGISILLSLISQIKSELLPALVYLFLGRRILLNLGRNLWNYWDEDSGRILPKFIISLFRRPDR